MRKFWRTSNYPGVVLTICCLFMGTQLLRAQDEKPAPTLQDIFASSKFFGNFFEGGQWAENGAVITFTQQDTAGVTHIMSLDLQKDEEQIILDGNGLHADDVDRLITVEDYAYNPDRSRLLIYTDSAPVWRQNTQGFYYIYDFESEKLTPIAAREEGYQMFAKFSPDGKHVGFVRNRNLYMVNLANMRETELISNGSPGAIINGTTDWVYEEELGLRDGWSWSPDSKHIAFYQFDESNTSDFMMLDLRSKKPREIHFRFPLAGEANSEVHIGVVEVNSGKTKFFDTGTWNDDSGEFEYIERMDWTPKIDGKHQVWMLRVNRGQNKAELVYGDPGSMKIKTILTEENDTWVEVIDYFGGQYLTYLEDGKHFLWASERDGYKHLYLYQNGGELVRQITKGDWEIIDIEGVDEKAGLVYFTGKEASPVEKQLYAAPIQSANGSEPKRITKEAGTHDVDISNDCAYFIDTFSDINLPPVTRLYTSSGEVLKALEENEELNTSIAAHSIPKHELLTIKAADGETDLYGYVIKPTYFDPNRSYPLVIFNYGGPGVQQVQNAWQGIFGFWHQYLAEKYGIIVTCFDNRGAAGYGKAFARVIHKRMGTVEPQDQLAVAKFWGSQPYVDASRIGMWGWSYGGYNTLNAMLKYDGPEVIKVGVAVAPGIDHELYDTIYTERYMSTPQENAENYAEASPKNFAEKLSDEQKLLMVQGDLDDNVHFQQTVQMIAALQKANKQFQLMIYPGGNHSMVGTGNPFTYLNLFTKITNFFAENL